MVGKPYIGIDDNGKIVAVDNAKKLLEEILNMISYTMTVICEVNRIINNRSEKECDVEIIEKIRR